MADALKWVNMAVKPHFSWPNTWVEVPFEEWKIVLQPRRSNLACTVSLFDENGISLDVGREVICRFLSCLAWSQNSGVAEMFICGSNNPNKPGLLAQGTYGHSGYCQIEPWDYLSMPNPTSAKAKLGLALYREAMSLNSIPFAFLSYYKILNILFSHGNEQGLWVNNNIKNIYYQPALDRVHQLQQHKQDIGKYLFKQGRCAVAHSFGKVIVNPDNAHDKRRLESDIPLIKELASICIESEFGVETDSNFWLNMRTQTPNRSELLKKELLEDGRVIYRKTVSDAAMKGEKLR